MKRARIEYYGLFLMIDAGFWFILVPLGLNYPAPTLSQYAINLMGGFGISWLAYHIAYHSQKKNK